MNEAEILAHKRKARKLALAVPTKVKGKILPPEKQREFEALCRGDLKKDLERINQNYDNIFGL